jgi:diguanylate cyclase (GGDEF)-like protein
VVQADPQGIISDANQWFAHWADTTVDRVVGHSIRDFLVHTQDDLFPAGAGSGPWVMVHPHDPHRAVMMSRHRDEGRDVFVLSEASERYRALSDLRRRYALADRTRTRLELIMDSSVAFANATTEQQLAEILVDTTERAYRAEESTVFLHQPDGTSIVAAGRDPLDGRVEAQSLIALASAPRRVVTVVDPSNADQLLAGLGNAMSAVGVRALIAAPLNHERVDFGAFISWFHHERDFDGEAAPLAQAMAGQAAHALATLRLQERLAHAALHDEVTGLPNRRLLEAEMEKVVGRTGCAALFIDLDGFKEINDRLGHHRGDQMLRLAAQRLRAAVRSHDLVARYGGDEFVIFCGADDRSTACDIAERALDALRADVPDPMLPRLHGASVGVAFAQPGCSLTAEQLVRRADLAMYLAKSAGGNRVELARG